MQVRSPRLAARLAAISWVPARDHIDRLLDHLTNSRRYSPKTVRNYCVDLRKIERDMGKPLTTVTGAELAAYLGSQAHLSAATIIRKQATLRQWARWALEEGLIVEDPTKKLVKPKKAKRLPVYLTDAQVEHLLATLGGDTPIERRNAAIIKCLYYTGMRAGELRDLDVSSWLRAEGLLRVIGKGDKERLLPVPAALAQALEAWLEARPGSPSGAMFTRFSGKRLTYDAIRAVVTQILRRAGLEGRGFTPHKFRHTFATRLVNRGVRIDKIQKLLGHENITTTTVYAHTELDADTRRELEDLL